MSHKEPIESEKVTEQEMIPFTSEIKVRDFDASLSFYTEDPEGFQIKFVKKP